MCNDFEQAIAYQAYTELMNSLDWVPPPHEDPAILAQAEHVRISDIGAVIRAEGDAPKLHAMRWSFPPA
jgi:putative SOS response-associated peptidase YedK